MLDSVRARLTLWYSTLMACVLIGIAAATYFGIRENAMRRTDAGLSELAESFLATVMDELHDEPSPTMENSAGAAIAEHNFKDVAFFIIDDQKRLVTSSPNLDHPELATDGIDRFEKDAEAERSKGDGYPFRSVEVKGRVYRGYARIFTVRNQKYSLVVLQSLHQQHEFLEEVAGAFAWIIPLVILLTGAGGYLLARKSLAPVVAMSLQAGRIGEANLHERLPINNERDELGLLAKSFNGLLDRLDQSFERQRRFVADASHELRTPVAVLCGEVEVALSQKERAPAEYRESLAILEIEAKRLRLIIEDLFTLARADAGQYPLRRSQFYLDELAAECCRSLRTLAMARGLTLHYDNLREVLVCADEGLLRRLILNLLDNAIKHTDRGGSVTVNCLTNAGENLLEVIDTGPGIPPHIQSKIFERFFRADKARTHEQSCGGAGLGLSISRWIAEAHHGRLELTRSDNHGSVFTYFFPDHESLPTGESRRDDKSPFSR